MTAAPSRPAPPPPPSRPPTKAAGQSITFGSSSGTIDSAQRICIYGPGGIGKSSLAAMAPSPKFIDLEQGTHELDVARVTLPAGASWTWASLRAALATDSLWAGVQTVVIDSGTRAEELATAHTIETIPHEKGHRVERIEDYGFGKGFSHIYDVFLSLFADLDRHIDAGRNVIVLCHDLKAKVPNPAGEDWIRYEPKLQSPESGKGSVRLRMREWCDHLLYIAYDVVVSKDGKGQGHGTRTIYPRELPTHMAKSRRLADPIQFIQNDGSFWQQLLKESK